MLKGMSGAALESGGEVKQGGEVKMNLTDGELDALAVRLSNGYDYLSKQEYEGVEYNRVWPTYEGLCDALRAELERRERA